MQIVINLYIFIVADVIESCDIIGSSDSTIKNVKGNDMNVILQKTSINTIFCNGQKAYELFGIYCKNTINGAVVPVIKLPSTSPANAAWNLERLITSWMQIKNRL